MNVRLLPARVLPLTHSCHVVFDPAFSRKTTLEHVLHVVRTQPQSSKDASSLLGDPGKCDAGSTRSVDRGDAPPRGAGTEFVFASAQGASTSFGSFLHDDETTVQPLDLTELDWLPPLWIAGRAECEVGKPCVGRLPAGRVGGAPWGRACILGCVLRCSLGQASNLCWLSLLTLQGHYHACVRTSSAAAIVAAVELHRWIHRWVMGRSMRCKH